MTVSTPSPNVFGRGGRFVLTQAPRHFRSGTCSLGGDLAPLERGEATAEVVGSFAGGVREKEVAPHAYCEVEWRVSPRLTTAFRDVRACPPLETMPRRL